MKIKIEIDTDDWKDTELIEKFMMDLLPADDSDGDRWQDNLPDTDVEIDIGGDKKNARLNLGGIQVGRYCLGENSCLHESNKLSPDPMYQVRSGKNIISNR